MRWYLFAISGLILAGCAPSCDGGWRSFDAPGAAPIDAAPRARADAQIPDAPPLPDLDARPPAPDARTCGRHNQPCCPIPPRCAPGLACTGLQICE